MSQLTEGLERHALEYLVMPLVTIDEYESKIDDRRVIVTGFYVTDQDPANDLSTFIEKSSIRPLDTDVSPAPTDEGYYLVFVEMTRNEEYPTRIVQLCEQINNLTNNKQWQFHPYGAQEGEFFPLTENEVRKHVNLDPSKVELRDEPEGKGDAPGQVSEPSSAESSAQVPDKMVPATAAESIGAFLANGLMESAEIRGEWLRITNGADRRVYRISAFKSGESPQIPVFGLSIGSPVLRESLALQKMLGSHYVVDCADEHVTISDGDHHLVLAVDA